MAYTTAGLNPLFVYKRVGVLIGNGKNSRRCYNKYAIANIFKVYRKTVVLGNVNEYQADIQFLNVC